MPEAQGPQARGLNEGIHIRQIMSAHVTSNMHHFQHSKNLPKLIGFALPIYITMSIRFDYGIFT